MSLNTKRRHTRIRNKVHGTSERPRLSVFRSLKWMYVQVIDDDASKTFLGMSDKTLKAKKGTSKKERAYLLGKEIAKVALEKEITKVVFDRGGNMYHGRVSEFAKGARDGGLVF